MVSLFSFYAMLAVTRHAVCTRTSRTVAWSIYARNPVVVYYEISIFMHYLFALFVNLIFALLFCFVLDEFKSLFVAES